MYGFGVVKDFGRLIVEIIFVVCDFGFVEIFK